MNLQDLIKLAGVTKSPYDTPVQEQPTEIEEQPDIDDAEGMSTLIALVTPEQLNKLQGNAPVEEEGFANSGDEYAGEPEAYNGTLGSPADLSLRRYLGANGVPVNVDENKVYEDHKVEDITEAWNEYKAEPVAEHHQKDADGNTIPHDDEVAEQKVAEEPNEANKFIKAKIDAEEDGEDSFTVDGKKYKVKDSADLDRLRQLAGAQQVDEAPFPGEYDYSDDKYDADGAVTGVGKQNYDMRFAKWKEDTPSQVMMVIKKYDLGPDDAYQMATADVNADIDAIADLHDEFVDRTGSDSDIDSGDEWLASPEYDKVMTMVGDLCSAMGMEGAGREECGQALMKHVDENAPKESVNEGGMKQAEIEVQDWVKKYEDYMGVNGDSLPEGYLQAMLNTGVMSDAFDQDEYIAFNKKNGYEDDGDWSEDDHDKFMQSSPITKGMFDEIRAIQEKYGIDEQGVNDIMGYFESVNRMKTLAGI